MQYTALGTDCKSHQTIMANIEISQFFQYITFLLSSIYYILYQDGDWNTIDRAINACTIRLRQTAAGLASVASLNRMARFNGIGGREARTCQEDAWYGETAEGQVVREESGAVFAEHPLAIDAEVDGVGDGGDEIVGGGF